MSTADAAREAARKDSGRFGEQNLSEPTVAGLEAGPYLAGTSPEAIEDAVLLHRFEAEADRARSRTEMVRLRMVSRQILEAHPNVGHVDFAIEEDWDTDDGHLVDIVAVRDGAGAPLDLAGVPRVNWLDLAVASEVPGACQGREPFDDEDEPWDGHPDSIRAGSDTRQLLTLDVRRIADLDGSDLDAVRVRRRPRADLIESRGQEWANRFDDAHVAAGRVQNRATFDRKPPESSIRELAGYAELVRGFQSASADEHRAAVFVMQLAAIQDGSAIRADELARHARDMLDAAS